MNPTRYEAQSNSHAAVTIQVLNRAISLAIIECEEADCPLSDEQEDYLRTTAMQMCDGLARQHREIMMITDVMEENRGALKAMVAERDADREELSPEEWLAKWLDRADEEADGDS